MIRLKTLLNEQQENPFAKTVQRRSTTQPKPAPDKTTDQPKPAPDKTTDSQLNIEEIKTQLDSYCVTIKEVYGNIKDLFTEGTEDYNTFIQPFTGTFSDDEDSILNGVFGTRTKVGNDPESWWYENVTSVIEPIVTGLVAQYDKILQSKKDDIKNTIMISDIPEIRDFKTVQNVINTQIYKLSKINGIGKAIDFQTLYNAVDVADNQVTLKFASIPSTPTFGKLENGGYQIYVIETDV